MSQNRNVEMRSIITIPFISSSIYCLLPFVFFVFFRRKKGLGYEPCDWPISEPPVTPGVKVLANISVVGSSAEL